MLCTCASQFSELLRGTILPERRLVITSDVYRSHAFQIDGTTLNRRWLMGLFHNLCMLSDFRMYEFAPLSEGGGFDLEAYRKHLNLPPTTEGWAYAVSTPVPDDAFGMFGDLLSASLVIGWGLTPSIMDLLDRSKISFIDVEIDPVRFADDLFFRMRTNSPQIARVLSSRNIRDEQLRGAVISIRGFAARRCIDLMETGKSFAIFVGQTPIDLALVTSGRLPEIRDYLDIIMDITRDVDALLVKAHPMADKDANHLSPIVEQISNAAFCATNTYRLLADIKLKHVVALSSSVLTEADLFGVKTTRLIECDRDVSALLPNQSRKWFRIPANIVAEESLLTSTQKWLSLSRLLFNKKPYGDLNLRESIGLDWAYTEFRSGQNLSIEILNAAA
jgi:hypothetical protein